MGALPDQKLQIVRTLVETAPDQVVSSLQLALASAGGDPALADVRRLEALPLEQTVTVRSTYELL